MIMKKYIKFLCLSILVGISVSSCLKSGLEDLPAFDLKDITGVQRVEYRFVSDETSPVDGDKVVKFVTLVHNATIDAEAQEVKIQVSTPAPSEVFPMEEKQKVSNTNIAVMVSISTAAQISPIGDAPKFGVPGDWSKPNSYLVKAADGSTKEWTVEVEPLPIVNQYEGEYNAVGVDDDGNAFSMSKYLSSVDESTCQTGLSVYGDYGYTMQIKVLPDNSIEFTPTGESAGIEGAYGLTAGTENSYNPTTKTYTLNYFVGPYVFSETLTLK